MHPTIHRLPLQMLPQPDETTCGPTCLHAVYRYWGEDAHLEEVIARTHRMTHGGTFAIFLGGSSPSQIKLFQWLSIT